MNAILFLLIWALPLLLTLFAGRYHARWTMPLAALPALLTAVAVPIDTQVSLPQLMLGVELGLDRTGRVFLMFSGLLWLVAGLFATGSLANDRHAARFRVFFLLAMAGNLGLIVAQDMVSFYLGFAMMGLAAYGLVAHPARRFARQAARRYLVWTIAGELILFVAIVRLAMQHGGALAFAHLQSGRPDDLVVLLLILGFGIKLALPGLHFWLPRAYAITPAPAVAVLSGAMIKAGLLGWLRFLPPGDEGLAGWGQALIALGAAGTLFGLIGGLLQRRPRVLLGYSSISKMGVLTIGMGGALAWPAAAPGLVVALALYAAHHALVKGALFLGMGLWERAGARPWLLAGLTFLALALAGAPLTSGALAKSAFAANLPQQMHLIQSLLTAAAVATVALMARLLWLLWRRRARLGTPQSAVAIAAWSLLLAVIAVFPVVMAGPGQLFGGLIPLALGVGLAGLGLLAVGRLPARIEHHALHRFALASAARLTRHVPPLWCAVTTQLSIARAALKGSGARVRKVFEHRPPRAGVTADDGQRWRLTGGAWLAIAATLLLAFMFAE